MSTTSFPATTFPATTGTSEPIPNDQKYALLMQHKHVLTQHMQQLAQQLQVAMYQVSEVDRQLAECGPFAAPGAPGAPVAPAYAPPSLFSTGFPPFVTPTTTATTATTATPTTDPMVAEPSKKEKDKKKYEWQKDGERIPAPMNGYFLYKEAVKDTIGDTDNRTKAFAAKWKAEPQEVKDQYKAQADGNKAAFLATGVKRIRVA